MCRKPFFRIGLYVFVLFCVLIPETAFAQRVLAISTTLSVTREAGRTYAQVVDLSDKGCVGATEVLPGAALLSPPQLSPDGQTVVLSSGPARTSSQRTWDYLSLLDLSSFALSNIHVSLTGEVGSVAALANTQEPRAIRLGSAGTGFLEGWPLQAQQATARWELPGAPVAATSLGRTNLVAVLYRAPSKSGAVLRVIDMSDAKASGPELPVEDERLFDAAPAGLAANAEGTVVFVLLSGHAVDRPSGEPLSWLHVLRTWTPPRDAAPLVSGASRTFRPTAPVEAGTPVEIPGVASAAECPLTAMGVASCWVTTRTPGTGFAHAVRTTLDGDALVKDAQVALTNVTNPIRLAVEPAGERLAVAVEHTLEIWRGNERGEIRHAYEQPVMALCWANGGLFIGEGRFVHQVEVGTAAPKQSVALQSGWVMHVMPIDAERRVAEKHAPSALPSQVLFHSEAVGQEIKAFRLGEDVSPGSPWHVSFNREEMPWLVIHPTNGVTPSVVYMGIDPSRYTPGNLASNGLNVYTGRQGPPHVVDLRLLPLARADVRRILWIWADEAEGRAFRDDSDPRGLRELGELLAGAPHFFSHREAVVPVSEPLEPFTVVVLDAAAAVRGAVTRQALLEYVMHGGALLFIGRHLPDADPEALASWLQPVQVEIDTRTPLQGLFTAARDTRAECHWRDVRLSGGCVVKTDDAGAIVVAVDGDPKQAAFLLRSYGRGRIAILAAPTPLLSTSLRTVENRRFAEGLFDWLAQAGGDTYGQDMDGDGIPDDVEDKNGNGLVEPGETDYLSPDTDGDGVSDGTEDANLNGVVDDGETSPLNPDSNSNGVLDGADAAPLPIEGAAVVTGVSPVQCAAEGGVLALITGRNFAPGSSVRFGEVPARKVNVLRGTEALVEVPPCTSAAGGDVPIRVRSPLGGGEAALPAAFHYEPLSRVTLALQGAVPAEKRDNTYHGSLSIRLDVPADVVASQVVFLVKVTPSEGFAWEEQPGGYPTEARTRLLTRVTQWGDLLVAVLGDRPGKALRGGLGEITWHMTPPAGTTEPLRFTIDQPRVMTPANSALDVTAHSATVTLP